MLPRSSAYSVLIFNDDLSVYVGAGIVLWDFIQLTIERSLSDITNMSWIPGTVGGALYMNAGAFGTEIEELVEYVRVIDKNGHILKLNHDECGFQYRKSVELIDKVVLGAKLRFKKGDHKTLLANSEHIISRRKFKQPLDHPSCGSVFKRPPGLYAGTLIEECELKGFKSGGAVVSTKHANFILNENDADSNDIYKVIKHIQKTVKEKKNVELEREVKLIGFKNVRI